MWWLLACASDPCPPGTARASDARCYAAPTADDVVASFDACSVTTGDGRFDPAAGCGDGVCLGDAYATFVDVLGPEASCDSVAAASDAPDAIRFLLCEWSGGIEAGFPAVEDDTAPLGYRADPDAASSWPLAFASDYAGTSADGLGVAAPLSCWIDALGAPWLRFEGGSGAEQDVTAAIWPEVGVWLFPSNAESAPPWTIVLREPR